jgi:hypothetical protein
VISICVPASCDKITAFRVASNAKQKQKKQKKKPSNCWNYFLHIHHALPLCFLEVEGKKNARGEVQSTFRSR